MLTTRLGKDQKFDFPADGKLKLDAMAAASLSHMKA